MHVVHSICIQRQQLEPVETQRKKNSPLKFPFTRRRRPLAGKRSSACVTSAATATSVALDLCASAALAHPAASSKMKRSSPCPPGRRSQ